MNYRDKTDGELLGEFVEFGADEAFEEVFRRHGAMVLRTCRRVLRQPAGADDAAQAVFAALAQRAAALRDEESVGGWLYTTAWHVSVRANRGAVSRCYHERRAAEAGVAGQVEAAELEEVRQELYRALALLSEEYRVAVVLHHLEGWTVEQCAELMGCAVGTMASRLSRGRAQLRERLAWRGIVVPATAIAALLSDEAMPAAGMPASSVGAAAMVASLPVMPLAAPLVAFLPPPAPLGAVPAAALATAPVKVAWVMKAKVAAAVAIVGAGTAVGGAAKYASSQRAPGPTSTWGSTVVDSFALLNAGNPAPLGGGSQARTGAAEDTSSPLSPSFWTSSSSSAVPEPSSLSLLAVGGVLLLRRRRTQG